VIRVRSKSFITVAVVAVLLLAACGKSGRSNVSSQRPTTSVAKTVEQALPRLKAMVDATASVVGAGFDVQPDNGFLPTGCEDSAGNGDGTITAPYGVKFMMPEGTDVQALFEKARAFWRDHGYQVGTDNLTTSDPRLHAWIGDYELALHIPTRGNVAYLGGDTPCLPKAKK
jgi:hypothetical protein